MKKFTSVLAVLASVCAAQPAAAFNKGDIIARVGAANINPNDSSSNIFVDVTDLGLGVTVDDDTQVGLNFAYFLTDRLSIEILAATPFTHDVNFSVNDPLSTGNKLGEVSHLPPTVTLNYYFNDPANALQPYIGIGLNYTFIFDEEFTGGNEAAGLSNFSLDDSFGVSAQIGVDYMLNDKWFLNGSIRWIDIDTDATFDLNGTDGFVSSIGIDPTVTMISLGYRY
jgi:outer membrane protein